MVESEDAWGPVQTPTNPTQTLIWFILNLKFHYTIFSCREGVVSIHQYSLSTHSSFFKLIRILLLSVIGSSISLAQSGYYKGETPFSPRPEGKDKKAWPIDHFGPVGLKLDITQPGMNLRILGVEENSPAAATGKFKKGQFIASINGKKLDGRDPRVVLGDRITESEAHGGKMVIAISDKPGGSATNVNVQLQDMGKFSATWPENCPKSDKIVRQFADFLRKQNADTYGAALFLLSTGEQKDLDIVKGWYSGKLTDKDYSKAIPWDIGYHGSGVCEYYLRTGDKSVLPAIEKMAKRLKNTIYNGAWAGRGGAPYPYGQLNASGVHCVTFLMLAKECGVKVDQETFDSALRFFYRFAGKNNVAYGNQMPEGGFVDNGKTSKLTFAMAAAAALTDQQEDSVYAKARDISATKTFYSTSWLFHGHTGGGIGELWRGQGMNVVKDKRPEAHRSFMDGRRWMYELARRHDNAFGWFGGWNVSYMETGHSKNGGFLRSWGNFIPMIFTQHKKNLRIHGAPKTKFSNIYKLPVRPWGTAADDAFLSLTPGEYAAGKSVDISKEKLETHASKPLAGFISKNDSDEVLLGYALHIDQGIRAVAAKTIASKGKADLAIKLLKSTDPRGRQAGLLTMTGGFKAKAMSSAKITPEMYELAAKMVANPDESWWVKIWALKALKDAPESILVKYANTLIKHVSHEEWWVQSAAIESLTKLATHKDHYQPVLTAIGQCIKDTSVTGVLNPISKVIENVNQADKQIKEFAIKTLGATYVNFPNEIETPGAQDLTDGVNSILGSIAANLAGTPEGLEMLYYVSRERTPTVGLPHANLYLKTDLSKLDPAIGKAIEPLVKKSVIPDKKKEVAGYLNNEIKNKAPGRGTVAVNSLYEKIGIYDYSWKPFGPKRDDIKWAYHTYNPSEKPAINANYAYRKVSWPKGMENWNKPGFNFKRAGWKMAKAPFAGTKGKKEFKGRCSQRYCYCRTPIGTHWDKEVLLMLTQMTLPPLEDDHAYALFIGGRSHAKTGDGVDVWINGIRAQARTGFASWGALGSGSFIDPKKESGLYNNKRYMGSIGPTAGRTNGTPAGFILSSEMREEIAKGKFTLAAAGFQNMKSNNGAYQSFWFEKIKLHEPVKKESK